MEMPSFRNGESCGRIVIMASDDSFSATTGSAVSSSYSPPRDNRYRFTAHSKGCCQELSDYPCASESETYKEVQLTKAGSPRCCGSVQSFSFSQHHPSAGVTVTPTDKTTLTRSQSCHRSGSCFGACGSLHERHSRCAAVRILKSKRTTIGRERCRSSEVCCI